MTPSDVSFLQELDPSPFDADEDFPAHNLPRASAAAAAAAGGPGLPPCRWESWLSAFHKSSTYPPTVFLGLHLVNTSLIPLVIRSVPASEPYLLLTRPIYQSPVLEHVVLTIPVLAHVASGLALRTIRSSRRARLYGAETRAQRHALSVWPKVSVQARLGYVLVPLLGMHVLVNRVVPLLEDGGSSGVSLGFVAHGFARSPVFWNIGYAALVAVGVWHVVGGWAAWMGWRVTTARKPRGRAERKSFRRGGYLGYVESEELVRRRRRMWWVVNGFAALGTSIWLVGALGVVGRGGFGSAWEARNWDSLYRSVPVIGVWL